MSKLSESLSEPRSIKHLSLRLSASPTILAEKPEADISSSYHTFELSKISTHLRGSEAVDPQLPLPRFGDSESVPSGTPANDPPALTEVQIDAGPRGALEFSIAAWETLLSWSLDAAGADLVFVMDWQGLVVAHLGEALPGQVERVGTRIIRSLDAAGRIEDIDDEVRAIHVDYGRLWVTGILVRIEGIEFTFGLIGPNRCREDVVRTISKAMSGKTGND